MHEFPHPNNVKQTSSAEEGSKHYRGSRAAQSIKQVGKVFAFGNTSFGKRQTLQGWRHREYHQ
jgi:hypothetical protein